MAETVNKKIIVSNVVKNYKRGAETVNVLNSLSLDINEGEFIALMGPSGSGKTTLLNIIAGLDKLDSGDVSVFGKSLNTMSESQLSSWRSSEVGFIFQFYNLIPVLSALENVSLPLSLLKLSKEEQIKRAEFALGLVGLGDRLNHLPAQLSGGQEQRVAIARAIVTDPSLLVADEPTGDLDRTSSLEILQLLKKLNTEFNKTIVMVTHDATAAEYASRIIHLEKGVIKE